MELTISNKIRENGKPIYMLSRDTSLTRFGVGKRINTTNNFHIIKENFNIMEQKVNSPRITEQRKFIISIVSRGDNQQYLLNQMSFNEDELRMVKKSIENILNSQ